MFACCVPAAFKSPFLGPPGSAALLIPPAALLIPVRYMARGLLFGALIPSMARGPCRSCSLLQWAVSIPIPLCYVRGGIPKPELPGFRGLAPRQTHPPTPGLSVIMSMINIIRHMCTRCSSICTRCVPAPTHSFKVHWECLVEKPKVVCFHCAFRVPFSAQGKVEGVAVDAKVEGVGHTPSSTVIRLRLRSHAFVYDRTPLSTP